VGLDGGVSNKGSATRAAAATKGAAKGAAETEAAAMEVAAKEAAGMVAAERAAGAGPPSFSSVQVAASFALLPSTSQGLRARRARQGL